MPGAAASDTKLMQAAGPSWHDSQRDLNRPKHCHEIRDPAHTKHHRRRPLAPLVDPPQV